MNSQLTLKQFKSHDQKNYENKSFLFFRINVKNVYFSKLRKMKQADESRTSTVQQWTVQLIVIIALIVVESPSVVADSVEYQEKIEHCNRTIYSDTVVEYPNWILDNPIESKIVLVEYNNASQTFISNDQKATIGQLKVNKLNQTLHQFEFRYNGELRAISEQFLSDLNKCPDLIKWTGICGCYTKSSCWCGNSLFYEFSTPSIDQTCAATNIEFFQPPFISSINYKIPSKRMIFIHYNL